MKFSFHLPLERVSQSDEFVNMAAVRRHGAGVGNGRHRRLLCDRPSDPRADARLKYGGHHSLDPFVALSAVAAVSTRIKLHTNIIVLAYRNPFLTAKMVASLDVLSGGRVILGVGAGYLEGEFAALGVPLEGRGAAMDEAIDVMRRVWTGQSVQYEGRNFRAEGNTALPIPAQRPSPPIWVGGNSDRAIRRAVETCDGWSPFPVKGKMTSRVRTSEIATVEDLRRKIATVKELAATVGRTRPFDICMVPFDLTMQNDQRPEAAPIVDQLGQLAEAGVTWASISLPCRDRAEYIANAVWFAADVISAV